MPVSEIQKIDQSLARIGLKAVLKFPPAKQYAKVNSVDNFCLATSHVAQEAIMTVVCSNIDTDSYTDWLNHYYSKSTSSKYPMYEFITGICKQAYQKLND